MFICLFVCLFVCLFICLQAKDETDIGDIDDDRKMATEQEYEVICAEVEKLRKNIENIKTFKELTEENIMETSKVFS